MKVFSRVLFVLALFAPSVAPLQAQIVDFEDLPSLDPGSYYDGVGVEGETDFVSRGATFNNTVDPDFFTWGGWAYSNKTQTPANADPEQPNYVYQYSAAAGVGSRGSAVYGVGYVDPYTPTTPTIALPAGLHPVSIQVTSSTYAALSILVGDAFTQPFSGPTDEEPGDWFKLTITGHDAGDASIGTVDFYLADYRSANPADHYVVEDWRNINLTSLHDAVSLSFTMASSDVGEFGINTPTYFAADDLSLTAQTGDVTADALVNGQDLAAIASHWLLTGPVADATGDGITNGQDIALVASHWLAGAQNTAQAVPEPAGWLLALVGLLLARGATKLRR